MTRTLSQEVLDVLQESRIDKGPVSLAFLARRFGVSSALMTSCARELVANGKAEATMATHRGVPAIQGLMTNQPTQTATAS
ncbi:MAG: hypothetical protein QOH56_1115 [Pseudonocardiales bacterium]|jgi:hypothetical protein|nr:hypothetical protein [Frankiales bacterium]MDQ1691778.1 hypothetical protein [Pseudonocardiales bacterium]MDQ1734864.1 hypothetical protein [Pseudonocardiales bacterium]